MLFHFVAGQSPGQAQAAADPCAGVGALSSEENAKEHIQDFKRLQQEWLGLTPRRREQQMGRLSTSSWQNPAPHRSRSSLSQVLALEDNSILRAGRGSWMRSGCRR